MPVPNASRRGFSAPRLPPRSADFLPDFGAGFTRAAEAPPRVPNRIGLASYSLWQFQHDDLRDLEKNIDLAAEWGFAGVEILHHQLQREDNGYFQKLKQRAALHGLDLYGMASHQTFLTPDENKRRQQIELTMLYLEQCYQLGIPTMRCRPAPGAPAKTSTT